jgi:hypothetical protein
MTPSELAAPRCEAYEDTGGVAVVLWPGQAEALQRFAATQTPRLVLVEAGYEPPVCAECCQDWMWRTGTPQELRLRLRQLSLRALAHSHTRPHLDSAGMLHVGLRSVHLTAMEQRMTAVLLEGFNERVRAADIVTAGWPGSEQPTRLAPRLSVLRRRLAAVALELQGSVREGYVLTTSRNTAAANPDAPWFDAELDTQRWLARTKG